MASSKKNNRFSKRKQIIASVIAIAIIGSMVVTLVLSAVAP